MPPLRMYVVDPVRCCPCPTPPCDPILAAAWVGHGHVDGPRLQHLDVPNVLLRAPPARGPGCEPPLLASACSSCPRRLLPSPAQGIVEGLVALFHAGPVRYVDVLDLEIFVVVADADVVQPALHF